MQVIVNPHNIQINKTEVTNKGEYNVQSCQFIFSPEYDNLTKVALFSIGEISKEIIITNDTCKVPYEVLENTGIVKLGVYGYEVDGEELIKRYSPTPTSFLVEEGSYSEGTEPTPPTPGVIEQILEKLEENSNAIIELQGDVSDIESEQTTQNANIQTNTNNITTNTNDISDIKSEQTTQDANISKNTTDIETLKTNMVNYSLISETGSKIVLELNSSTYEMTAKLYDKNNNLINTSNSIDLPLETMVVSASYDSTTKEIVLTLQNGTTLRISVADLVSGLQTEITSTNKLLSDLVDDTNNTNKFVTAAEKTTWNNKQNALTFDTTPTQSSTNPVTSGGVYSFVTGLIGDIDSALDTINGEVVS